MAHILDWGGRGTLDVLRRRPPTPLPPQLTIKVWMLLPGGMRTNLLLSSPPHHHRRRRRRPQARVAQARSHPTTKMFLLRSLPTPTGLSSHLNPGKPSSKFYIGHASSNLAIRITNFDVSIALSQRLQSAILLNHIDRACHLLPHSTQLTLRIAFQSLFLNTPQLF